MGSLQEKLNGPLANYFPERCIYRVPKRLRQTDEQAYTPILIPIGPYHYQFQPDTTVEDLKLNYLNSFLNTIPNIEFETYSQWVRDSETDIRKRYADPTSDLDSSDFCEMVLTDSAFLIELFRKGASYEVEDDLIWGNPSLKHEVFRDILLVENQLPFFVLRDLLRAQRQSNEAIAVLVCNFLENNYGINIDFGLMAQPRHLDNIEHLLDLVRSHYVGYLDEPTNQQQQHEDAAEAAGNSSWIKVFPTATKLVDANVKFRVGNLPNLMDVKFEAAKGLLTLPKLAVGDRIECLFRNLIAYERCHYPLQPYFICYIYFVDCLIDTPGDIQVLAKANVIENLLGSEKNLSQMLNSLCKNVDFNENAYSYALQSRQINAYYSNRMNHYIASLKQKYFASPWSYCSFGTALYLVIITIAGAVAAILSVPGLLNKPS